jgi:hypothetical protein
LLEGPAIEQIGDGIPPSEVDGGAREEERRVQIGVFAGKDRIRRDDLLVCPLVKVTHAEHNRQEQHRQDRQHARRCADRPPNHDAPGSARELMDHCQRERSQRQAEHEDVGHQVRLEELRRVHRVADQRHRRGHGPGE